MADALDEWTDVVLSASRALVAVASRSIAAIDDEVTLPQFRALVVLDQRGGRCRVGDLAAELLIQPSTATRLCDRLVRRRLAARHVVPENRREVDVMLLPNGKRLVDQVTGLRRREIAAILERVPLAQRRTIVAGLSAFSEAAGPELAVPTVPW